jgi:hypothetical protein
MNMQDLPLTEQVPPLPLTLLPQARQLAQQTGRPLIEVLEELSTRAHAETRSSVIFRSIFIYGTSRPI